MEQEVEDICTGEEELSEQQSWHAIHHTLLNQREMDDFKKGRESKKVCTWYDISKINQAVVIHIHINVRGLFLNCTSIKKQTNHVVMQWVTPAHL